MYLRLLVRHRFKNEFIVLAQELRRRQRARVGDVRLVDIVSPPQQPRARKSAVQLAWRREKSSCECVEEKNRFTTFLQGNINFSFHDHFYHCTHREYIPVEKVQSVR